MSHREQDDNNKRKRFLSRRAHLRQLQSVYERECERHAALRKAYRELQEVAYERYAEIQRLKKIEAALNVITNEWKPGAV